MVLNTIDPASLTHYGNYERRAAAQHPKASKRPRKAAQAVDFMAPGGFLQRGADNFSDRLILILIADYSLLARDHRMEAPLGA